MKSVDNPKELTCLSLCTGYGGIELGLRRAIGDLRTIAYVEIECFACANLVAKMEAGLLDAAPIWTDLKTFDGRPFRGRVDIITGGYPCQPWSHAGKRQGEDDPRHLFPYIAEIVRAVQPLWCFFENVAGHLSLGFPSVYRSLRDLGYKVEAGLFTAAECGAPHKRQRLFILAHRESTDDAQCKRGQTQVQLGGSSAIGGSDVPDTKEQRLQTAQREQDTAGQGRHNGCGQMSTERDSPRWPAGPGQPQYEWEEPRVVEYPRNSRRPEAGDSRGLGSTEQEEEGRQSESGGTASGVGDPSPRTPAAREGQPQYEWEEPRVVADTKKRGLVSQTGGQAEPPVGQPVDGRPGGVVRSRVDQLRLLGNGVVPAQAELAFRTLYERTNDE